MSISSIQKLAIISTLEMLFPIQANDFEFMEFYN